MGPMDDADDKGFEIQMDTKRLVFVFLVAVATLAFIFLLGVHTGRGVRKAEEESAAATELTQKAPPTQLAETKPAKDLEFFDQYNQQAEPTTLEPAKPAEQPSGGGEPAGSTAAPPETARETPPAATSAPTPEPEPAPQQVSTAATAPPPAGGGFVIQVLSTADSAKANALVAALKTDGFPAFVQPVSTGGGNTYRVRVGPYASRPDAEKKSAELRAEAGISDTWITAQ